MDALIHITVPKEVKAAWVRSSRAANKKLTDYIINAMEHYMEYRVQKITIPEGVEFSDLKLQQDHDGDVSFDLGVIKKVCQASGVPIEDFLESSEDNLAALIVHWYEAHLAQNGKPDPIAENLKNEVRLENELGQDFSYPPISD